MPPKRLQLFALLAAFGVLTVACGPGSAQPDPPRPNINLVDSSPPPPPGVEAGVLPPDFTVDIGPPPPRNDAGVRPDLPSLMPDTVSPPPPQQDSGTPPPPPGDYDYRKHLSFVSISKRNASCPTSYGTYYCDVLLHTQQPYMSADVMTNIHETQHFMAHEHDSSTAAADKFIYLSGGQGAFFPEPPLVTSDIYSSIKWQGSVHSTYISGRPSQALGENIVDEWRAYITEEIVAIEWCAIKNQTSGFSGLVLGGIQFLYYNAAMLHAVDTKKPGWLQQNPAAPAIFAMLAEETKRYTIDRGVKVGLFTSITNQKMLDLLNRLRTDPAEAHIRQTLTKLFGSVWTQRVLGF
ncbi:MAG: hypothetical protein KC503_15420 [Myxococcales bacterium]|nr:hypothetical protein [Myxococcales bacterium]